MLVSGFDSHYSLQPFYISSDNGNGCFAARVRGLMRKAQTANFFSNSQKDKTFPLNGNNAGSIPASVKRCALLMVDSSKWSGGLPLTQRIAGSNPLSTTSVLASMRYSHVPLYNRRKPDSVYKLVVRPRCGADRIYETVKSGNSPQCPVLPYFYIVLISNYYLLAHS